MAGTANMNEAAINNTILVGKHNFDQLRGAVPYFAHKVFGLLIRIETGQLFIKMPQGQGYHFDSGKAGPVGHLVLNNWNLARKAVIGGTIGFAESYIDGDWDSPDVSELLCFFLANRNIYGNLAQQSLFFKMLGNLRHWLNRNTKAGSQRNIAAHYDLGNEFYEKWLDPSMTYSSGIFSDGANSLERAQHDKYRSLAENIGIKAHHHVLEIGCGWGGFAEFVAREIGAKVTGLTISREQLAYGRKRIEKAGLSDRVNLKFQDYRDETGKYDHIASIEMFEAVGEQYWPGYFGKIRNCLKPGGRAGLQIITIENKSYSAYRNRSDFIQRYIFPGGMLPSPQALDQVTRGEGMTLESERIFPQDYARTLKEWRLNFNAQWPSISRLGFDERFRRMWEFYLYYCEAGFRNEGIDVRQMFYRAQ